MSHKKYFAKHIELKEDRDAVVGDRVKHVNPITREESFHIIIASEAEGHIGPAMDDVLTTAEGEKLLYGDCIPVRLLVCSRDIRVTTPKHYAMELLMDGTYDEFPIDTIHDIYPDMIAGGRQFRVIGKVSEDAKWVKEGDEFDEQELGIHDDSGSDYPPTPFDKIQEEDWPDILRGETIVEIMCSTCKTFH